MNSKATTMEDFYGGDYNTREVERCSTIYFDQVMRYLQRRNWYECKSLDVGCDDGVFSIRLQKLGFEPYGMDMREFIVEKAKKKGIHAVVGNVQERFPYASRTFDLVFCGEIIEHLWDTSFFIQECERVCKPGGIVIITTPNLTGLVNRMQLLRGQMPGINNDLGPGSVGHIRYYTFPDLKDQLRRNNLRVIAEITTNFPFPMVASWMPQVGKNFAIWLGQYFPHFGSQIISVSTPINK